MSAPEVGQRLRQARQARDLELEAVAKATRIRIQYLRALEDGEFGKLPSPAQVRGFLRTYAEFLELDPQTLFDLISPKPTAQGTGGTQQAMPATAGEQAVESQASQIFAELGAQLRQRRERLELTPIEVEENTHISEHYVLRLEAGGFDSFPSPTQARGMLGNYAEFLGLDSDAMLLRYAEALQQRFQAKQAAKPPKPQPRGKPVFRLPSWLTNLFSRDILFGGLAGLLLLIFVVWSIGRIAAAQAGEQPEPTAPPLTGLLLSTPQAPGGSPTTMAGTPGSINLLGGPTTTPGLLGEATIQVGEGAIQLRLISAQRTWMRITVDGEVQFEGRTLPGETYTYNAAGQILLLSGNGAALRGFLNDQDLGILGIYGEVINIVFTREGAATPTPSPTPTIDSGILTATAGATQTPSATLTPTPVPTETVDAGGDNP